MIKSMMGQPIEVGDVVAWTVKGSYKALRIGIVIHIVGSTNISIAKWGETTRRRVLKADHELLVLDRLSIPGYVEERKRLML